MQVDDDGSWLIELAEWRWHVYRDAIQFRRVRMGLWWLLFSILKRNSRSVPLPKLHIVYWLTVVLWSYWRPCYTELQCSLDYKPLYSNISPINNWISCTTTYFYWKYSILVVNAVCIITIFSSVQKFWSVRFVPFIPIGQWAYYYYQLQLWYNDNI